MTTNTALKIFSFANSKHANSEEDSLFTRRLCLLQQQRESTKQKCQGSITSLVTTGDLRVEKF